MKRPAVVSSTRSRATVAATSSHVSRDIPRLAARAVAIDVDGTLLDPDHLITDENRLAVHRAKKRGLAIILASSRGPKGLSPIQEQLGLLDSPFVCYQGALTAEWARGRNLRVLSEALIDPLVARRVEALATELGVACGRYTGTRWRVLTRDATILREAQLTGEKPMLTTPDFLEREPGPHKLLAIARDPGPSPQLRRLAQLLEDVPVSAVFSHDNYLEITAPGVDKATGLEALARHMGIPLADFAAVGDGHNDLGMFCVVGCPVAMGQAPAEVKEAARWITGSNRENGLASVLDTIELTA